MPEDGGRGGADAYVRSAARFQDLLADLDDGVPIPATPAWCARDLLAHVVGVAADVVGGNVGQYAQPAWTEVQVAVRAGASRQELLAEWDAILPTLRAVLRDPTSFGLDESFGTLPVIDLLAHEHDLREAAGIDGFGDPSVWDTVSTRRREVLALQMASLPPLEVRTPEGDRWTLGAGEPVVVVADRYELWRSLEGRRPRRAVRAFDWSADPEPFLDHWTGFVFRWPDAIGGRAGGTAGAGPET